MNNINLHIRLCPGCHVSYVGSDGSRLTITCEETSQDAIEKVQEAISQLNASSQTLKEATES